MIVDLFIETFWQVGTALVDLVVPVIVLFIVFKIVKDLLK